jgi:GH25 family lysozyme M1 (1,4-beta-N-acetylmuramidase)|nr:MAG TPA: hypothetical protein [Caudoviricetes sp.]
MKRFCKRLKPLVLSAVAALCAVGMTAGVAMADLNGIDVSGWQPASITRAAPADFAIIKATEGTNFLSGSWVAQATGAVETGKALGLYHYADGGDAISEADHFVNTIGSYAGRAVLVLDWEGYGNASWGNGSWVRTFVNRVHDRTSVWPMVYVQASAVWQIPSDVRQHCALWKAQYASNAATGYQTSPWNAGSAGESMLQYTSNGRLAGYNGPLDLDRFFGDRTAWGKIACGERRGCVPGSYANTGAPTTNAHATAPAPTQTPNATIGDMATRAIRGEYGNGSARKARLGSYYDAVMAEVNRRLTGAAIPSRPTTPTAVSYCVVVRSGDTLGAIASRSARLPASAWTAPSGNINVIYPGQRVCYRGAVSVARTSSYTTYGHVVRSGESLWSIYGSGWASAAARNGLRYPYTIYPGQALR